MALGSPAQVISGRGTVISDMGTSFSAPVVAGLVACLWQALKDKTALQIMDLVRKSGNNYNTPNDIYGYGIPDFWKAYNQGNTILNGKSN
jgi:subtilisin family serine protease